MATLSLGRLILPLVLIHVIHHSVHSIDTITPALTVISRPNNTINDTTVEKSTLNPFMQTQIKQNVSLSSVNHIKSILSTHENVTEKNVHIPFVATNQKLATQSSGKTLVEPEPITESVAHHSQFKWNSVSSGQQNSLK
ncbi:hypothetical protein BLOT_001424 [Blomia tropicalis]|nr:hypothetical protein BLOT_001424 [Blomia tropicalis]